MAYVNVAEWSPDQTADWLKGVGGGVAVYASFFLSNEVRGQQLLRFRADDLENLNIRIIGHQELILEAVAQLQNFHYELDRENLQHLALKLSCVATSLYNELLHYEDSSKVETQTLSDVANVIKMVKPLVLWLDRAPFSGQSEYSAKKADLLRLSLEMATSAQRDRFAESPLEAIRDSCKNLYVLADIIIQEISDPMVLQPATLDLVTLKKRENELGFDILPNFNGLHQVIDIKFGSPAHSSGKIEEGDEIVQVNYQTVVGWQPNEVLLLCQESPIDVLLTLKKRPRHIHTYGQIYMKPYRLPSRKRSTPYNRWGTISSPRPELLKTCNFEIPRPKPAPALAPPTVDTEGNSSSDESEMLSPPASPTTLDNVSTQQRIYMPKPRSVVQRRNSISGSIPMSKRGNLSIEQFWRELKNHKNLQHSGSAQITDSNDLDDLSDSLCRRDKSVSCSTGLEISPRPKTCLGVGMTHTKVTKLNHKIRDNSDERNVKTVKFQDELISNSVSSYNSQTSESESTCDKESKDFPRERGRLDKSHSTPAYDFGESEDNEFPLMKEIIPESPTSSIDSPLIIIHSPQKIEQILEFKKSSEQIGGAMIQQQAKATLEAKHNINESKQNDVNQILQTINTALIEKEVQNTKSKYKNGENIFVTEFGEPYSRNMDDSDSSDQVFIVQNDKTEALNEQQKTSANNTLELKLNSKPDVPPEPPPRPLSTQKPGYIPPKPKNIQKDDIQVIPNVDINPPHLPQRKDFSTPINSINLNDIHMPSNALSSENIHSTNNLSTTEHSLSRSPLMVSRSLQRLESDPKSPVSLSHSSINKLDTSLLNLKCNTLEGPKLSISPANSMVRGILSTGKSKNLKKKNSILAKRRKVSVKDLGTGDMQGFLYQRCRSKNNSNFSWQLRWFILIENTFYGFKSKESTKAECLIFLNGFTVSKAQEVKSKPFAFRVYHTGTTFYFACEDAEAMRLWEEYITRATLTNNYSWERASKKDKKTDESKHFSETDYSDDDFLVDSTHIEKSKNVEKQEKNEKSHKFGSLKKFANRMNKSDSRENVSHSSTSLDRKYLKFFSSKHKHKEEKSKLKSNDIPVPTEQYRSYRKIPSSSITLQADDLTHIQISKMSSSFKDDSNDTLSQNVAKIKKIESIEVSHFKEKDSFTPKQNKKVTPLNYIHASNPNLLDFEKSDFVTKPKNNIPFQKSMVQRQDNFIGFVTLEQFMLNKQEEERREVYSNRVLMGVERDLRRDEKNNSSKVENVGNDNLQRQLDKIVPDVIYGEIPTFLEKNITPTKVEQIQNRCLPKTPDDREINISSDNSEDIFKKPCTDISRNERRSFRSSSKKKNDGYETINYDEMTDVIKKSENAPSFLKDVNELSGLVKMPSKNIFHKNKYDTDKVNHKNDLDVLPNNSHYQKNMDIKKDFAYEMIYGDDISTDNLNNSSEFKYQSKSSTSLMKDLGYETIYGENLPDCDVPRSSLNSNSSSVLNEMKNNRKISDGKKPIPPPKSTKPKHSISRQSSLTSVGDRKLSSPDTRPVFVQGDSPEKFWLDSLRRNDKVYSTRLNETSSASLKSDKFYTKHSEPFIKSSEATIVKSEKMQNKTVNNESPILTVEHKPLKSATQYTPMSLPLMSPNKALKTSPKFELTLDSRDNSPTVTGISRFRQIFQHNNNSKTAATTSPVHSTPKEKTLLGSPRLHRAIFRKQQSSSADEWTKDFSYSKIAPPVNQSDCVSANESYLFSPNEPILPGSTYDDSNVGNNATTPDYPNLEYPPVFEAETYTLANPGPSILRKMHYDQEKK